MSAAVDRRQLSTIFYFQRSKRSLHRRLLLFNLTKQKLPGLLSIFALQTTNILPCKGNLLKHCTLLQIYYWRRNQNFCPVVKPKADVSLRHCTSKRVAVPETALFFSTTMKKFVVFILVLSALIVSEYYFLTEFFTQKRLPVITASLLVILLSLYILVRFFKRSVISS